MSDKLQQNPNPMQDHENCPGERTVQPAFSSPETAPEGTVKERSGAAGNAVFDETVPERVQSAVHAEAPALAADDSETAALTAAVSEKTDDISAILAEVEAKRLAANAQSSDDVPQGDTPKQESVSKQAASSESSSVTSRAKDTVSPPKKKNGKKKKRKKKKRKYTYAQGMRDLFPKRGDSAFDVVRKIIFLAALIAFAVCLYLIADYYIDRWQAKKLYESMQEELSSHHNTQSSQEPVIQTTPQGEVYEYLEYNHIADIFLERNSDLVGYITIDGTNISYPVVQRKSTDPNINTNDYYLYRAFDLSNSKSGCIFMDFRCHFDEVVGNRRITDNSEHLLIYGHNMNNKSMFGSLKYYYQDHSYYSKHPIITLDSLYKTYYYKIFAVLIVDGADTTSEYAFDCWNTFDFDDETEFYEFVNNAKKRTIVTNDVDVTYGDQLLTLYTCNGTLEDAKLIVMARLVRDGEDPYEGTSNGQINNNTLWPKAYYDYGNYKAYDPELFVPYG